jgi:hypothetical protein
MSTPAETATGWREHDDREEHQARVAAELTAELARPGEPW